MAPMTPAAGEPAVTVLLVDDEPALLRSIARILSRSRMRVLTAESGARALELLKEGGVDVLVSDIDMPEMTGLELVRLVKRDYPSVLRMLLTASVTLDRALHAINEGEVIRFFAKPFDVDLFRGTIESLVDRIERQRREDKTAAQRARRESLESWLQSRYPGLLDVERSKTGEVLLDVAGLTSAVGATSDRRAQKLLLGGEDSFLARSADSGASRA